MDQIPYCRSIERRCRSKLLTRTKIAVGIAGIIPVDVQLAIVTVPVHARNVAVGIPFFARPHLCHHRSFAKPSVLSGSSRIYSQDVISPRSGKQFRKFGQTVIAPFQTDQLYQPKLFYNIICKKQKGGAPEGPRKRTRDKAQGYETA